jgi:peptidoglycan hydrolase CwlO-like protein
MDKKISLRVVLLTALIAAATAFKSAAESAKQAVADDDAKAAALQTQLDDANAKLEDAQKHLADFQAEETLDQHPELVSAMSDLGVTDGQVTPPPAAAGDTQA